MLKYALQALAAFTFVLAGTVLAYADESAKSSPHDTTPYNRPAVAADTAVPLAPSGTRSGPVALVRQVDVVVNNTDPNLKNTDTFSDQETSIAINPNAHNEIVISAFSGAWGTYPSYAPLWLSQDGGQTWTKEFTVGQPFGVTSSGCPCDQVFDYGTTYAYNNPLNTVLFGTILSADGNIYTGDIVDPALQGNWAYYSGASGMPSEQTNRQALSDGKADQPWMLRSRSTFSPDTQFVYVAYDNFGTNPVNLQVAKSDGSTPPHFPNGYDEKDGTSSGAINPGHRLATDPRNGWVYSLWQTCVSNCATLSANPKLIQWNLNRSTDDGFTWSLNGQSGGIPIVLAYSTQPQPKFGTVNALLGGIDHAAVDPSTGDLYYVTGYKESSTDTNNELAMVRVYDCGGGNVCSAPLTRVVSGTVQAALPSVAVTKDGTVGVFYYTYNGMVSGFPQFSTWLATSTDKGATFNRQLLATFLSPATDNGDGRQRVFGDYVQMKAVDNCFYGSYSGNGAAFGRSFANNDPIFFLACVTAAPPHDFNGDGKSDILWRNGNGDLAMWFMNGGSFTGAGVQNVPTNWSIIGSGDFNGDGFADIFWMDTAGNTAMWLMNGNQIAQAAGLGNLAGWNVVAVGDFNGDGKKDILWRNQNGDLAMWFMNGTSFTGAGVGNVPTNWRILGSGDFNGDGKADLLWMDNAGNTAVWLMNGAQMGQIAGLGNLAGWAMIGVADFDGDGKSDILWRNPNGDVAMWFMNGVQVASGAGIGNMPTYWFVAETGDFNGDGKGDILWRGNGGEVAMWLMNGAQIASPLGLPNVGTFWTVQSQNAN